MWLGKWMNYMLAYYLLQQKIFILTKPKFIVNIFEKNAIRKELEIFFSSLFSTRQDSVQFFQPVLIHKDRTHRGSWQKIHHHHELHQEKTYAKINNIDISSSYFSSNEYFKLSENRPTEISVKFLKGDGEEVVAGSLGLNQSNGP